MTKITFTILKEMKNLLLIIGVLCCMQTSFAQEKSAFQDGEWYIMLFEKVGRLEQSSGFLK